MLMSPSENLVFVLPLAIILLSPVPLSKLGVPLRCCAGVEELGGFDLRLAAAPFDKGLGGRLVVRLSPRGG